MRLVIARRCQQAALKAHLVPRSRVKATPPAVTCKQGFSYFARRQRLPNEHGMTKSFFLVRGNTAGKPSEATVREPSQTNLRSRKMRTTNVIAWLITMASLSASPQIAVPSSTRMAGAQTITAVGPLVPAWFAKAPPLAAPRGEVIRVRPTSPTESFATTSSPGVRIAALSFGTPTESKFSTTASGGQNETGFEAFVLGLAPRRQTSRTIWCMAKSVSKVGKPSFAIISLAASKATLWIQCQATTP